jgi:hypothetical protein
MRATVEHRLREFGYYGAVTKPKLCASEPSRTHSA